MFKDTWEYFSLLLLRYLSDHKRLECSYFSSKGIRVDASKMNFDGVTPEPLYDAISPLRVLLLREQDPAAHAAFAALQTHLEEWDSPQWRRDHEQVLRVLREQFEMKDLGEEDLLAIYGAFYTNDFSVRIDNGLDEKTGLPRRHSTIRLCFALSSMLSNECVPSTW